MNQPPACLNWDQLREGMSVRVPFKITHDDMQVFAELSGDRSRIHHDSDFAKANGFAGPVVYGALTVARLSNLVGMHLPGDLGLATGWKIDFNRPLYVDEDAEMEAEITQLSEATRVVMLRFKVRAGGKTIASGTAGSKLLTLV